MTTRSTAIRDLHRAQIRRGRPACAICGAPINYDLAHLDPMAFVVDHVIPLAAGGTDTLDNKQSAHRSCNRAKSNHVDGGPVIKRSSSLARPQGAQPVAGHPAPATA